MILVSRNYKYARIFAGAPLGRVVKYNKCKRLADEERGVFILGTCRCVLLATQLLATFKVNIRSFDQCAECDLLKFVQKKNPRKLVDVGVNKFRMEQSVSV